MNASRAADLLVLAVCEGALVGLPKPNALPWLHRLRSPLWAIALPGSILVGTLAPLASPALALALVVVAAAAMLPLAAAAVVTVIPVPRLLVAASAVATAIIAGIATPSTAGLSITILTVLACLSVGTGLARLIPGRWMLGAVLCMCGLDVAFLAAGIGDTSGALLNHAASHLGTGAFSHAQVGRETLDYPDLVLAAALGGFLAGHSNQRRAAWLVAALCGTFFLLAPRGAEWPATVPLGVALVVLHLTGSFGLRQVVSAQVDRSARKARAVMRASVSAPAPASGE